MVAIVPKGDLVALGLSGTALLFIIVVLGGDASVPLQLLEYDAWTTECDLGYTTASCSGTATTTEDMWQYDCALVPSLQDDCETAQGLLKAGFAFILLGLLLNAAFIVCLIRAAIPAASALPSILGKRMLVTVVGAVVGLLYFLGVVLSLNAYPAYYDSQPVTLSISGGGALIILALILINVADVLAYLGIDPNAGCAVVDAGSVEVTPPDCDNPATAVVTPDQHGILAQDQPGSMFFDAPTELIDETKEDSSPAPEVPRKEAPETPSLEAGGADKAGTAET